MSLKIKLADFYNVLYERYGDFHQPTFELTLLSACAGNIAATLFILFYITRNTARATNKIFDESCIEEDTGRPPELLYEGELPMKPSQNETILKTPNSSSKRKQVGAKVYVSSDCLPTIIAYTDYNTVHRKYY